MNVKRLLINHIHLPMDVLHMVKDYVFHRIQKIAKDDNRYCMLMDIPEIERNTSSMYVQLCIHLTKDYIILRNHTEIVIQTTEFDDETETSSVVAVSRVTLI